MIPFVLFVGTVFAANWALDTFGFVSVGFGLVAPAGVYFAGAAFSFRDWLHETLGPRWVILAIAAGGAASYLIEPQFALASTAAFALSELADFAVYTPLRQHHRLLAIAASNTIGSTLDSVLFLWLAFGSLTGTLGLVIGKAWITAATLIIVRAYFLTKPTRP